jgi:hypothetical protein
MQLLLLMLVVSAGTLLQAADKPNVLFIAVDDLRPVILIGRLNQPHSASFNENTRARR